MNMLHVVTTDEFARWFAALDDALAEDVAAAVDVIEQLGPERAAPGSRESLLWYEHPSMALVGAQNPLAWSLEAWGTLRDYARQLLVKLESPRFASRLERLPAAQATAALRAVQRIRAAADPRTQWALKLHGRRPARLEAAQEACAELRRAYFAALEAAGFLVTDVPAHSLALREVSRRLPAPAFRLLYGVNAERETALLVLGERLDRTFYGDSVCRAEATWKRFLDGELPALQPMQFR
jgi:hypothetical protein